MEWVGVLPLTMCSRYRTLEVKLLMHRSRYWKTPHRLMCWTFSSHC